MTRKNFVIDTSVLVYHEDSIHAFPDSNLFIPMTVLEELDGLKVRNDSIGNAARYINRFLDGLREQGSLINGVKLENNQKVFVIAETDLSVLPESMGASNDNKIIAVAKKLSEKKRNVIVLSRDIAFRVKCDSIGLKAENYSKDKAKTNRKGAFTGVSVLDFDPEDISEFYSEGSVETQFELEPNEFVVLKGGESSALGIYKEGKVRKLNFANKKGFNVQGIKPRNKEQNFAAEMLLDPDIHMVTISGMAGSGKTLIATACAFEMLFKDQYQKIVLSRPVKSMSADIGYLPGPQPLDAKILTPNGWTTMGEIKSGDKVISRDGKSTEVLDIFPKGKKDVFRVTTTSGTTTECCEDHLWLTKNYEEKKRGKKGSVRSLKEISNSLFANKKGKEVFNHYLPRNEAVEFENRKVTIPAYTMGALLGDGSICKSIVFYNTDTEMVDRVNKELNSIGSELSCYKNIQYYVKNIEDTSNKPGFYIGIKDLNTGKEEIYKDRKEIIKKLNINRSTLETRCKRNSIVDNIQYFKIENENKFSNIVKDRIYKYGILNLHSHEKYIPEDYKYNSIEVRLDILRGLMDSDGTVKKNGEASFTTTSKKLAEDVIEITRSLGGRANLISRGVRSSTSSINSRDIKNNFETYEFTVSLPEKYNPFFISRKAKHYKQKYIYDDKIKSIELVGQKEVQCILVENEEHLYITDDYIVTHNTKDEKMQSWVQPFFDNMRIIFGDKGMKFIEAMQEKGKIEVEALTYIRGRTLPDTIFIIDEAQNITYHEAKAVLTRMGENSKIILLGDLEQIDAPHLDSSNSGLAAVVELFKDFNLSGHITLLKGERSPLAAHAAKIL